MADQNLPESEIDRQWDRLHELEAQRLQKVPGAPRLTEDQVFEALRLQDHKLAWSLEQTEIYRDYLRDIVLPKTVGPYIENVEVNISRLTTWIDCARWGQANPAPRPIAEAITQPFWKDSEGIARRISELWLASGEWTLDKGNEFQRIIQDHLSANQTTYIGFMGTRSRIHEGMEDAPKDREFLAHKEGSWTILQWGDLNSKSPGFWSETDRCGESCRGVGTAYPPEFFTHWCELPGDPTK